MEPQPGPPTAVEGQREVHSRNSVSCRKRPLKSPSFHFISSDSGHPEQSRNASGPTPLRRVGGRGEGGVRAARVSPHDPVWAQENSKLFLLMQSG